MTESERLKQLLTEPGTVDVRLCRRYEGRAAGRGGGASALAARSPRSTPQCALVSDGLLHAGELFALAAGFFLIMEARRWRSFSAGAAWAGYLIGLGAFQLWDGIVDHKVLRVHQIRYGVELLPYDLLWNAGGLVLLVCGIVLAVIVSRRLAAEDSAPPVSG